MASVHDELATSAAMNTDPLRACVFFLLTCCACSGAIVEESPDSRPAPSDMQVDVAELDMAMDPVERDADALAEDMPQQEEDLGEMSEDMGVEPPDMGSPIEDMGVEEPKGEPFTTAAGAGSANHLGQLKNGELRPGVGLREDLPNDTADVLWTSEVLGHSAWDHNQIGLAAWEGHVFLTVWERAGGGEMRLVALDPTGKIAWSSSKHSETFGSIKIKTLPTPVVHDGKVFVTFKRQLWAYDALSGRELWHDEQRELSMFTVPVVLEDRLVVQVGGTFKGYHLDDGPDDVWTSRAVSTKLNQEPRPYELWRASSGKAYMLARDGHMIHCIDPADGSTLWSVAGNVASGVAPRDVHTDHLVMSFHVDNQLPYQQLEVFPDRPQTPARVVWSHTPDSSTTKNNGYFVYQGTTYFGYGRRAGPKMYAFDGATGELLYNVNQWEVVPGLEPTFKDDIWKGYGECVLADGKMYAGMHRRIAFFRPNRQGVALLGRSEKLGISAVHAPLVTPDGKLYAVGTGHSAGGELGSSVVIHALDMRAPAGAKPTIVQDVLSNARTDEWTSARLWVSGGNGWRTWSVSQGALPPGLAIDPETHRLEGRPDTPGTYTFTLRVEDEDGDADEKAFTIEVSSAPDLRVY